VNRKQRRSGLETPDEEPYWKRALVPHFPSKPLPKKYGRAVLRGALVAAALGALAILSIYGLAWLVRHI